MLRRTRSVADVAARLASDVRRRHAVADLSARLAVADGACRTRGRDAARRRVIVLSAAVSRCGLPVSSQLAWPAAWRGSSPRCLIAFTPVFLFQSIQPMSDVPVTAAWMVGCGYCSVRDLGIRDRDRVRDQGSGIVGTVLAGAFCALAVLIRPNLAPLAAVPLFAIGLERSASCCLLHSGVDRRSMLLMFLQWLWYGSPLRSGYGTADELFALAEHRRQRFTLLLVADDDVAGAAARAGWRSLSCGGRRSRNRALARSPRWLLPRIWSTPSSTSGRICGSCCRRWRSPRCSAGDRNRRRTAASAGVSAAGRCAAVVLVILAARRVAGARARDTFRLADQQRACRTGGGLSATHTAARRGHRGGRAERRDALLHRLAPSCGGKRRRPSALTDCARDVGAGTVAPLSSRSMRGRTSCFAPSSVRYRPSRSIGRLHSRRGTSHRTRVWRLSDRDRFLRASESSLSDNLKQVDQESKIKAEQRLLIS